MTMTIDDMADKLETTVDVLDHGTSLQDEQVQDLFDISNDLSAHSIQLRKLVDSYAQWRRDWQIAAYEGSGMSRLQFKAVELLERFGEVGNEMLKKVDAP